MVGCTSTLQRTDGSIETELLLKCMLTKQIVEVPLNLWLIKLSTDGEENLMDEYLMVHGIYIANKG